MKKILALLLSAFMVFSCMAVSAAPENGIYTANIDLSQVLSYEDFESFEGGSIGTIKPSLSPNGLQPSLTPEFDYIRDAIINMDNEIVIYDLKIPEANISNFMSTIMQLYPELFNVKPGFSYRKDHDNITYSVILDYKVDKLQQEAMFKKYYSVLDKIVSAAPQNATDLQLAMYAHEYLTTNSEYAYIKGTSTPDSQKSNAYDLLVNGTAVCQGYALAYNAILTRLGVNCFQVQSDKINHIWNIIEIGGKYYHVDVTHDDPTINGKDAFGKSYHNYFLLSNNSMASLNRQDMKICGNVNLEGKLGGTEFESGHVWNDGYNNPFVFANDAAYMLYTPDRDTVGIIKKVNADFIIPTEVLRVKDTWCNDGDCYYGFNSGFIAIGDKLFVNTSKNLVEIDLNNNYARRNIDISNFVGGNSSYNIHGIEYNRFEGTVDVVFKPKVNGNEQFVSSIYIPQLAKRYLSVAITLIDVRRLLSGAGDSEYNLYADVNGDNSVNILDLVLIKKHTVGE